jgi:hypothetical protein
LIAGGAFVAGALVAYAWYLFVHHCAHHGPDKCRYDCSSITKAIIDLQLEISASAQRCGITYSGRCLADRGSRLVIQMEMSSILTLDAIDRAIGDFLVGLPVQRPPADRNPPGVLSRIS